MYISPRGLNIDLQKSFNNLLKFSVCVSILLYVLPIGWMGGRKTTNVFKEQRSRDDFDGTFYNYDMLSGQRLSRKEMEAQSKLFKTLADGPDGLEQTYCQVDEASLVGPTEVKREVNTFPVLKSLFPQMKGGWFDPQDCKSEQRVAVIIPFNQEAEESLRVLLHNLIPIMTKQKLDFTIFVIEQMFPKHLNPGMLYNIGFKEVSSLRDYDCFVFHDVNVIPIDDRIFFTCGDRPKQFLTRLGEEVGTQEDGEHTFGSVMLVTREQYMRINGASNLYFGFEGVDENFWRRVHAHYVFVTHIPDALSAYSTSTSQVKEESSFAVMKKEKLRRELLDQAVKNSDNDGLSSLAYSNLNTFLGMVFHKWFQVSLDRDKVIQTAPKEVMELLQEYS